MIMQKFKDFVSNIKEHGVILAMDWGRVRAGVAVSDINQEFAFPYMVIKQPVVKNAMGKKNQPDLSNEYLLIELKKIIADKNIVAIIIGLPTYIDGSESDTTEQVRKFADFFANNIDLPIAFMDETLSSIDAAEKLGKRKNDDMLDACAAAVILEDALSKIKREKNNEK